MLKAILIGLSKRNESAQKAYSTARGYNHKIEELIEECQNRSNKRYKICTKATRKRIQKIEKLGIGIRYDLDMKTKYKKQSFSEWITGNGPVSGVVIDEEFQREMRNDFYSFVSLAKRIYDQRLKGHNIRSGCRMQEVDDYIKKMV